MLWPINRHAKFHHVGTTRGPSGVETTQWPVTVPSNGHSRIKAINIVHKAKHGRLKCAVTLLGDGGVLDSLWLPHCPTCRVISSRGIPSSRHTNQREGGLSHTLHHLNFSWMQVCKFGNSTLKSRSLQQPLSQDMSLYLNPKMVSHRVDVHWARYICFTPHVPRTPAE